MIRIRVEDIEDYLGKPVNDPYGRRVGYIIGFYSDSDGYVTSLEISIGDYAFKQITIERFEFENGDIILIPEWEYEAKKIENRLERLRKRIIALNELNAKKDIPVYTYEQYSKDLENTLIKVKEEAREVKNILKNRMHELEDIIVELEKTLTSLKVNYLAGEIPDKAYKTAADHIRKHLDFSQLEKENVKKHLEKIESLEKQPIDIKVRTEEQAKDKPQAQNQALPVVVLET